MVTPAYTQRLLRKHGTCKPQKPAAWKGSIALPEPLRVYYLEVGPVNITIENQPHPFFLPRLSQLWKLQEGYRWNASTGEDDPDWDPSWIVVATQGADPFVFRQNDGRILWGEHGAGDWDLHWLFPDILSMAVSLAVLGKIAQDADGELFDESYTVRTAVQKRTELELKPILGSAKQARLVLQCVGWL